MCNKLIYSINLVIIICTSLVRTKEHILKNKSNEIITFKTYTLLCFYHVYLIDLILYSNLILYILCMFFFLTNE